MSMIDDLERLGKAATPGDWEIAQYDTHCGFSVWAKGSGCIAERWRETSRSEEFERQIKANAQLIAAARNALPRLIAVWRAAEAVDKAFAAFRAPVPGISELYAELCVAMRNLHATLGGNPVSNPLAEAARSVASFNWGTSVSEAYHSERMAAMDKLRALAGKEQG